jgi:hypothetical protein
MGRDYPEMSAGDLFDEAEWKSVCKITHKDKPVPKKPPPLGEFVIMVATLGGYIKREGGGPPGVKAMWKGMSRMMDFAIAWDAFGR